MEKPDGDAIGPDRKRHGRFTSMFRLAKFPVHIIETDRYMIPEEDEKSRAT
jgi:hypothetical protein